MKKTFYSNSRWDRNEFTHEGDIHPRAVSLDGKIIMIDQDSFDRVAKDCVGKLFVPMGGGVEVFKKDIAPKGYNVTVGTAEALTVVIAPDDAVFLYGVRCPTCGRDDGLSVDPDDNTQALCIWCEA